MPAALALGLTGDHDAARMRIQELVPPPPLSDYGSEFTLSYMRGIQRRRPDDHALTIALVQRLATEGRYDEAFEVIKRVPDMANASSSLRYWRAYLLMENGEWDQAWAAWIDYLWRSG